MNQKWYWVGSGQPMNLSASEWHTGGPNGLEEEEEYCSDFIKEVKKCEINDAPCRSNKHIWKFICEKIEDQNMWRK